MKPKANVIRSLFNHSKTFKYFVIRSCPINGTHILHVISPRKLLTLCAYVQTVYIN